MVSTLFDHYRTLGVSLGAGIADVTASYKRLCRKHHPDINDDPDSVELMKNINIAYSSLREKFRREAAFRDRQKFVRPTRARRHPNPDINAYSDEQKKREAEAESKAFSVMHEYFRAISACDYAKAYSCLSSYDKNQISFEGFVEWRKSVARLHPMREFKIAGGLAPGTVKYSDGKTLHVRKFKVTVTEENFADDSIHSGVIEKLATNERGSWKVFLGYKNVRDLTRNFDEKLEARKKRDLAKYLEEYYASMHPEYNMLSISGIRKTVSREIYRQRRFGGSISFAAVSITAGGAKGNGQDELLRSAARTISRALRETDVPAYAGDGVFVLLLVELKKKNADEIMRRLVDKIRQKAGPQLGASAAIEFAVDTWSNGNYASMDEINKLLARFSKKM